MTKYKATRFKGPVRETCVFEIWIHELERMGQCGRHAVGKVGVNHLCSEHFDYVLGLRGIHASEVQDG